MYALGKIYKPRRIWHINQPNGEQSKIDEVTDAIIKATDESKWATVDRLQKVLEQLVKIEVAAIKGKEL